MLHFFVLSSYVAGMMRSMKESTIRFVEHGEGVPVVVLHGAGVDHREAEACFEPGLARDGVRRIYVDLPGMGKSRADESIRSGADVVEALLTFTRRITCGPVLLVGHSAGAYFAQAVMTRDAGRCAGLALVCPLLPDARDVPPHEPVQPDPSLGTEDFRDYFVVQTPEMLARYEQFVVPGAALVDVAAMSRIGSAWEVDTSGAFEGPVLVIAGRQDSTVGSAGAIEVAKRYPQATLAVLDRAGHALPHEQPLLLRALLADWLARGFRAG